MATLRCTSCGGEGYALASGAREVGLECPTCQVPRVITGYIDDRRKRSVPVVQDRRRTSAA